MKIQGIIEWQLDSLFSINKKLLPLDALYYSNSLRKYIFGNKSTTNRKAKIVVHCIHKCNLQLEIKLTDTTLDYTIKDYSKRNVQV